MTDRDRAIGALVGLAVGDAVGTTLEFKAPGTFEPIDDMVGGGPFKLEPGQWTDDTSLAMCLAESILDRDYMDPADQLRRYVEWHRHGHWSATGRCFDIGGTTLAALDRFERTGAVIDDVVDQEQAANGSLMRLAAVPIRWHHDLAEAAEQGGASSLTTHPASRPVDACRVYSAMIAALIQGYDIHDVLDGSFWRYGAIDERVHAVAAGSWRSRQPPHIRGTGYVVDALEAALWAVGGATDFRDAVLRAANLGHDADTTAAIAGQLAGARWGFSGIPAMWRERITEADRIAGIAAQLFDIAAAQDPPQPWPHDGFLHGYWVEPGRVLAGEYPGHPSCTETARSRVNLLVDHGIRTFVDLTAPADAMTPYEHLVGEAAERRSLDLRRVQHPIPDMGTLADPEAYGQINETIRSAAERGGVYIHCWGGVGRTGTVIGCLLVDGGLSSGPPLDADSALDRLAELRSASKKCGVRSPETGEQLEVIRRRSTAG